MRARKAGGNGAQRSGSVKSPRAKARGGSKTAASKAAPTAHKEAAPAVKKNAPVMAGGTATHRSETPAQGVPVTPPPRGNPPPLPSPIASFNF